MSRISKLLEGINEKEENMGDSKVFALYMLARPEYKKDWLDNFEHKTGIKKTWIKDAVKDGYLDKKYNATDKAKELFKDHEKDIKDNIRFENSSNKAIEGDGWPFNELDKIKFKKIK